MTKSMWLEYREKPDIPIEVWHFYYMDMGGTIDDLHRFKTYIMPLVYNSSSITIRGKTYKFTLKTVNRRIRHYYDKKFNI